MPRYRKIDVRIWDDENFRGFDPLSKLITIYLFSSKQTNRVGLYSFSSALACEDLETLPQTFAERFGNVISSLKWAFEERSRVLFIPTWWKYNIPENPNVLKGCLEDLHDLPATELFTAFSENTKYLTGRLLETFTQTLAKRFGNVYRQKQKQKQKQNIGEPSLYNLPKPETGPEGDIRVLEPKKETENQSPLLLGISPKEKKQTEKKQTARRGFEYTAEFEQLWSVYPNHNAKGAAFMAFQKANKNGMPALEIILVVIAKAKRSKQWMKQNGEFIPLLSTWLNQHRWDDDYGPASQPRGVVC